MNKKTNGAAGTRSAEDPYSALVMSFSPEDARRILQNTAQPRVDLARGFFESRMVTYRRAMMRGDWRLNRADPIMFNVTGALVNGRHRMEALSRCPDHTRLPFAVLHYVTAAEVQLVDRAKARSLADALQVSREDAAVANFAWDVCHHGMVTPSEVELRAFVEVVQEPLQRLREKLGSGRRKRYWTSAPVLMAPVVMGLEHGLDSRQFVHSSEQLAHLVRGELRNITNAALALLNQFESTRSLTKLDVFARSLFALDPARGDISKITLKDRDIYIARLRAVFRPAMQALKDEHEAPDYPGRTVPAFRHHPHKELGV